jgi:hypothetical protein
MLAQITFSNDTHLLQHPCHSSKTKFLNETSLTEKPTQQTRNQTLDCFQVNVMIQEYTSVITDIMPKQ